MKALLTITDVVAETGISRSTVYTLINSGRLRAVKVGRRTLFRRDDVAAYLDGLATYRPAANSNLRPEGGQ